MGQAATTRVESESIGDFALVMQHDDRIQPRAPHNGTAGRPRLDLDPERLKNGLGQLVLTVVKLLHELLERQALRRIEGLTLMGQAKEIDRLRKEFGLEEDDLNLDLGPLGKLF
jgi:Gas vesicle protein K